MDPGTGQQHQMIEPFSESQVSGNVISYGLSSYGYDLRVSDEFKIFTNVNSAIIDPKAFDERSFVSVRADSVIVPPNSFALARSVEYFRIPRDVLDDLRWQVNLCALRDHRERDAIRAGVGGVCDTRDIEYHPATGQSLCQRRALPDTILPFRRACEVSYADRKGKYQRQQGLCSPSSRLGADFPSRGFGASKVRLSGARGEILALLKQSPSSSNWERGYVFEPKT